LRGDPDELHCAGFAITLVGAAIRLLALMPSGGAASMAQPGDDGPAKIVLAVRPWPSGTRSKRQLNEIMTFWGDERDRERSLT
jgi:hypothetical protein